MYNTFYNEMKKSNTIHTMSLTVLTFSVVICYIYNNKITNAFITKFICIKKKLANIHFTLFDTY